MNFHLIDSGWNGIFRKSLTKNHSELRIICPFIKKGVTEWLLKFGKPHTLQVITRFNLKDFCGGASDVSALRLLLENSAEIRGVRNLHAMDERQGYLLFASTKKHSEAGKGNTNPHRAYSQQSRVKLSDEGHDWLKKELEIVFRDCGMLGRKELEKLDWPEMPK